MQNTTDIVALMQTIQNLHRIFSDLTLVEQDRSAIQSQLSDMDSLVNKYVVSKVSPETCNKLAYGLLAACAYLLQILGGDNTDASAAIHEIMDWARLASQPIDDKPFFRGITISTKNVEYETDVRTNNYASPDAHIDFEPMAPAAAVPVSTQNQGFFYYELLGQVCDNKQCLKSSEVTLMFSIDKSSTSAVKAIGKALKELEYVDIFVIADGFTKSKAMQGRWVRRLWLAKSQDPDKPTTVEFTYIAGDIEKLDAGFSVRIDYKGRPVYHFWLDVSIVDALDCKAVVRPAPLELDLDKLQEAKSRQPPDLTISLTQEDGGINIYAAQVKDGFPEEIMHETADIDINRFIQIANTAKTDIDTIANQGLWNKWEIDSMDDIYRTELSRINEVSDGLRASLVIKDDKFKRLIEAVENLKPGSRITICSNTLGFPWDMMRIKATVDDDALDFERYWGIRYRIECLRNNSKIKLSDKGKVKPVTKSSGSSLVCLIDNSIDDDHGEQIVEKLQNSVTPDFVEQCANKKSALKTVGPEKCVYIFCHAVSDQPLVVDGSLELEKTACSLRPTFLAETDCYQNKPLIIINACSGTAISPFAATSFSEMFSLKNAQGVVGSLFVVPTTCATKIGIALLEGYIIKQDSIGDTLAAIRREWLAAYNPIPLFYQLQCNMDAKL